MKTLVLRLSFGAATALAALPGIANAAEGSELWSRDNLLAWCIVPFDAKKRGPEQRAEMLERLGIHRIAYDWRKEQIPTFDAEVEALQRHGIELYAWWFPLKAKDPLAKSILDIFRRHNVRPQLWVYQSVGGWPKPPEDQARRLERETQRIVDLEKLAAPYGVEIELYNHNDWFGIEDNELAILDRLHQLGIYDVGMVYNFSHARDKDHDDTADFPAIWRRIQSHVVAVNISGTHMAGTKLIYPSQGDRELEMMRTIQDSGWKGPVGIIAENGGDAQVTLQNYMKGLDWLATELREPRSGGPRPFPSVN